MSKKHQMPIYWMVSSLRSQVNHLYSASKYHDGSEAGHTLHAAYVELVPILDLLKRQLEIDNWPTPKEESDE